MPSYTYECENCSSIFELFSTISDYQSKPPCIHCKSKKTQRRYIDDVATINTSIKKSDTELRTIGDLANRNRDKMSDDQKEALYRKHNGYKETESDKELPKGMSRMKKPKSKIKWRNT